MLRFLFPIQLHLLMHASPLAIWPSDGAEAAAFDALARRGLLRRRAIGCYRLTALGARAMSASFHGAARARSRGLGCEPRVDVATSALHPGGSVIAADALVRPRWPRP